MADVVTTVTFSALSYTTWLRTSLVGLSTVVEGTPMIESIELGTDQEDAFENFKDEACREVLKIFMSRQGNVTGVPFEQSDTEVTYRFKEEIPVLAQADAIKASLNEDVKNAIYTYIAYMWLKIKKQEAMVVYLSERYEKLSKNIENHLYKLHD